MSLAVFLSDLRKSGIELSANGDRLRCNAPPGSLTPEVQEQLRLRKPEILGFLQAAARVSNQPTAVVPLQRLGAETPVFAVAGHNGDVFCYRTLAERLGNDQPFYGLQPPGLDGRSELLESVDDLARYFAGQIRQANPRGPYIVAGYCAGGAIAFELARRLQQEDGSVRFLALFACPFPTAFRYQVARNLARRAAKLGRTFTSLSAFSDPRNLAEVRDRVKAAWRGRTSSEGQEESDTDGVMERRTRVEKATLAAVRRFVPTHFPGRVCFFLPNRTWLRSGFDPLRWRSFAATTEEYFGPERCRMEYMLRDPEAPLVAELFKQARDKR